MIPVKVCGITREEDARRIYQAGAAALGFIFYPPSPRFVTLEQAAQIVEELPRTIARVGVFVDAPKQLIEKAIDQVGLDYLQLHGQESPQFCRNLPVPVIKAFRVGKEFSPAEIARYDVHAVLLDTYKTGRPGGTGETFDWSQVRRLETSVPVILSGGLNPENILEAIKAVQPAAVDVNSGVETAPGVKDPQKIDRLFTVLKDVSFPYSPVFRVLQKNGYSLS